MSSCSENEPPAQVSVKPYTCAIGALTNIWGHLQGLRHWSSYRSTQMQDTNSDSKGNLTSYIIGN